MRHYIALIHKEPASGYGVSFPDVPGVIAVGDTAEDAMLRAGEVLAFAAEDWEEQNGAAFPAPRSIDELRNDRAFVEASADALLALIPWHDEPVKQAAE